MLGHLHDTHVVLRDPGGAVTVTHDPQAFVNWDRSVWQQYIARANWTQGLMGPLHSDFGPPVQRILNPRGAWQHAGDVLLLIGRRCASSNESFIEAMRQLPNVTLVGDRTAGTSANPETFPLANGWTYTVSRWIEYTADGQVIEDVGISPRIFVAAGPSDFMNGGDPVLDWALRRGP